MNALPPADAGKSQETAPRDGRWLNRHLMDAREEALARKLERRLRDLQRAAERDLPPSARPPDKNDR